MRTLTLWVKREGSDYSCETIKRSSETKRANKKERVGRWHEEESVGCDENGRETTVVRVM